jgi:hypothetical protein
MESPPDKIMSHLWKPADIGVRTRKNVRALLDPPLHPGSTHASAAEQDLSRQEHPWKAPVPISTRPDATEWPMAASNMSKAGGVMERNQVEAVDLVSAVHPTLRAALAEAASGDLRAVMRLGTVARSVCVPDAALVALVQQHHINTQHAEELAAALQRATWSKTGAALLWCKAVEHHLSDEAVRALAKERGLTLLEFARPGVSTALVDVPKDALTRLEWHVEMASTFAAAWADVARLARKLGIGDDDVEELAARHSERAAGHWRSYAEHHPAKEEPSQAEPSFADNVDAEILQAIQAWKRGGHRGIVDLLPTALERLQSAVAVTMEDGGAIEDVERLFTPSETLANRILRLLVDAGANGLRKTEIHAAFDRHVPGPTLNLALAELATQGLVSMTKEPTAGRSVERWRAVAAPGPAIGPDAVAPAPVGPAPRDAAAVAFDWALVQLLAATQAADAPPQAVAPPHALALPLALPALPQVPALQESRTSLLSLLANRYAGAPESVASASAPTAPPAREESRAAVISLLRAHYQVDAKEGATHQPHSTPQGALGTNAVQSVHSVVGDKDRR